MTNPGALYHTYVVFFKTDVDVDVLSRAGNVYTCNYAIGNVHCYYLDYCSSGVTVNGGACINSADGVKLNAGKK